MNELNNLRLDERSGLPDEMAFLRSHYPRDAWRSHTNFGQLADFWLHVHAGLRHEASEVSRIVAELRVSSVDATQFRGAFVPSLNGFLQHLDQHHRIEDHAYFPKFRQLDERLVVGFDLLEADHHLIHQQLLATVEQARELLGALPGVDHLERHAADAFADEANKLSKLLEQHLTDEEDLVIPAVLKHGERSVL